MRGSSVLRQLEFDYTTSTVVLITVFSSFRGSSRNIIPSAVLSVEYEIWIIKMDGTCTRSRDRGTCVSKAYELRDTRGYAHYPENNCTDY